MRTVTGLGLLSWHHPKTKYKLITGTLATTNVFQIIRIMPHSEVLILLTRQHWKEHLCTFSSHNRKAKMRETDRERKGKKYVNDIRVKYKKKKKKDPSFQWF